jgi:hypothetical protein
MCIFTYLLMVILLHRSYMVVSVLGRAMKCEELIDKLRPLQQSIRSKYRTSYNTKSTLLISRAHCVQP